MIPFLEAFGVPTLARIVPAVIRAAEKLAILTLANAHRRTAIGAAANRIEIAEPIREVILPARDPMNAPILSNADDLIIVALTDHAHPNCIATDLTRLPGACLNSGVNPDSEGHTVARIRDTLSVYQLVRTVELDRPKTERQNECLEIGLIDRAECSHDSFP
jgi:hypothetical protein